MLFKNLHRLKDYLKRKHNASQLGLSFNGVRRFQLPASLVLDNKTISLDLINDHSTMSAFIDVVLDDCYGLAFFRQRFPGIRTIIDIGANQGLFLLQARNIFPSATIHAYEPNEMVTGRLANHATQADAQNFNQAVGLTAGKIFLKTGADTLHGKTFLSDTGSISQVSIKEVLKNAGGSADLVKLDCEGAEWEIFQDGEALKNIRAVTLEYHLDDEHRENHKNDHTTIIRLLENNSFKILKHQVSHKYWGMIWASR